MASSLQPRNGPHGVRFRESLSFGRARSVGRGDPPHGEGGAVLRECTAMVSIETIRQADYSTLVGSVRERTRLSGGVRMVDDVAHSVCWCGGVTMIDVWS